MLGKKLNKPLTLNINNQTIEEVDEIKYFRILIDNKAH